MLRDGVQQFALRDRLAQYAVHSGRRTGRLLLPCLTSIGLQQDPRPGQLPRRVLATLDQRIQTLSFFRTELHDILLYGDLFRGHESTPSLRYGAIDSDILLDVNDVAD